VPVIKQKVDSVEVVVDVVNNTLGKVRSGR
jgi:hypothetical protein